MPAGSRSFVEQRDETVYNFVPSSSCYSVRTIQQVLEVRMSSRLVFLLVVCLAVAALSQQPRVAQQINQRVDSKEQRISQVIPPTEQDARRARLETVHHDAQELRTLSASVQSDLEQLGKGLLAKDLQAKLKKMEKLSKRLRQEMNP